MVVQEAIAPLRLDEKNPMKDSIVHGSINPVDGPIHHSGYSSQSLVFVCSGPVLEGNGVSGRGIFIRGEVAGECIVDGRGMPMKPAEYKPEKKFRVDSLQDGILETKYFLSYDQAEKQFMLEVQCGRPASLAEYLITPHSRWRVIQEEPSEVWKEYREKNILH